MKLDEENHKEGELCKPFLTDQRKNQITTNKIDKAVQAKNLSTPLMIQTPVCLQTVRNTLEKNVLKSVVKAKSLSQAKCRKRGFNLPCITRTRLALVQGL